MGAAYVNNGTRGSAISRSGPGFSVSSKSSNEGVSAGPTPNIGRVRLSKFHDHGDRFRYGDFAVAILRSELHHVGTSLISFVTAASASDSFIYEAGTV